MSFLSSYLSIFTLCITLQCISCFVSGIKVPHNNNDSGKWWCTKREARTTKNLLLDSQVRPLFGTTT